MGIPLRSDCPPSADGTIEPAQAHPHKPPTICGQTAFDCNAHTGSCECSVQALHNRNWIRGGIKHLSSYRRIASIACMTSFGERPTPSYAASISSSERCSPISTHSRGPTDNGCTSAWLSVWCDITSEYVFPVRQHGSHFDWRTARASGPER